ncbi:MAG: T9SS type A sorting domain-containing protein [bacterium]|nr:T9SS type A sorting domain-containing protein [bacterium]
MKKIFLLIIILNNAFAFGQWTYVSTIPSTSAINCISVVNQNLIWVCGDNRAVYKSTNGGVNWLSRSNTLPATGINSISALDTSYCWVGTVTGSIYKTLDGGNNWTLQFSLAGSFSNGIKMFNQNYGIYYGDPTGTGQPHQWRYTINGGTNWILSPNAPIASPNEYGLLNAWDWTDTGKVWISTGNLIAGATTARTFRTSAGFGGGGWTSTGLTGTGNGDGLYFSSIAFTDNNKGMCSSNGSGDAMRKTTDGGATWTVIPNPPGVSNYIPFNMCGLKDGSNLIFVFLYTNSNKCFKTTDYGTTWVAEPLPVQAASSLRLMQFLSPSLGYGAGGGGRFIRYGSSIGISMINTEVPSEFSLGQNYPNPFNPSTTINFSITRSSMVTLKVYDALGKEVASLLNEFKNAGNYAVDFNASGLNSGIYFYTISAGEFTATKKLMLLK